ncbi:MAG: efflux RND transporter periplasmic adaptor subunit [Candidatus Omnitrophica bacterium]|nr:efflux RND transporter periplasmic adaptor subunit [Candidatus Omnitrophota bacterium]
MKRGLIFFVSALMITGALAGCGGAGPDKKAKDETVPVRIMKVRLDDVSKALEYAGTIKGQDEAIVYPKVSGKIIEKVKEEGSAVNKGDVIAYIDRDEVGLKFEKAPVESPLTGTVGRIYVDLGSSVTMTTPVALVADTERAEIDLNVPEAYLPRIKLGQKAIIEVDAYPGEEFVGEVVNISPVVDIETRTAPVEIIIDNKDRYLQSGMFAKVNLIIGQSTDCPVILKEAIIGRADPLYVYVVEDGLASLRQVKLGSRKDAYVEVLDGLRVGDAVVIMGQQKLRDGARVTADE